jgi:undecaprenyl-diphosphatase
LLTTAETVIVGVIQGILEWLPVSSEGNLSIILVTFLGISPTIAIGFSIFLHIGTGLAALLYYRKQVLAILLGTTAELSMFRLRLVIITFLTGLVGLPLFLLINVSIIYGETLLALTGVTLIVTGLLQRNRGRASLRSYSSLSWGETFILGVIQGFSIIPGLSRSGVTTSMLLLRGFRGEESFRISFLMSIPASFAAGFGLLLVESFDITTQAFLALGVCAVTGILTIGALVRVSERVSFWKLCIILGVLVIFFFIPNLLWF